MQKVKGDRNRLKVFVFINNLIEKAKSNNETVSSSLLYLGKQVESI